ncbi:MAG TPA: hypothetical protein PKL49_11250 [Steroidobacteraceae bacterium]|uniref:hypothetical protein n=1 Tax=Dokdonella sp. TaxID=2291710 RepID=UPI0025C2B5A1|nr:hypothetical protein [Dokdonella sp.]MBX3691482.1 hypothetical protein [Dokdonella sp.]MCW5569008.1 hypothetical protein [Dokdonella sp.]HNR23584.1 hypothetical protein [Steroidobacteraceae bacterium]
MLDNVIPVKTEAGRQEIENRSHHLGPRHRTVLIAINGQRQLGEVRRQFASFGDVAGLIGELAEAGLIEFSGSGPTKEAANESGPASVDPVVLPADAITPAATARKFMNNTVVDHLGLRSFLFTLKLERCDSQADFLEILPEYRRQLRKVLDNAVVNTLHEEAEALIARI